MPSRSKDIFNLNYCILPIVYISIRIFVRFLFRTYFSQHTFSNGRSNQWKSGLWFYFSYSRFFYPCTETTKFKEKKKNRFKFVKLNLSLQARVQQQDNPSIQGIYSDFSQLEISIEKVPNIGTVYFLKSKRTCFIMYEYKTTKSWIIFFAFRSATTFHPKSICFKLIP